MILASRGSRFVSEACTRLGANPSLRDAKGRLAWHYAALAPEVQLQAKVVPPLEDKKKEAEIKEAAKLGSAHALKQLYSLSSTKFGRPSVDVFDQDNEGSTALMLAADSGNEDVVEWFLSELSKKEISKLLDMKDNLGRTAAQRAARGGHLQVAERLIPNDGAWQSLATFAGSNGHLKAMEEMDLRAKWAKHEPYLALTERAEAALASKTAAINANFDENFEGLMNFGKSNFEALVDPKIYEAALGVTEALSKRVLKKRLQGDYKEMSDLTMKTFLDAAKCSEEKQFELVAAMESDLKGSPSLVSKEPLLTGLVAASGEALSMDVLSRYLLHLFTKSSGEVQPLYALRNLGLNVLTVPVGGKSAFEAASIHKSLPHLRALLDLGADPNSLKDDPVPMIAAGGQGVEFVRALVAAGGNVNLLKDGSTALTTALTSTSVTGGKTSATSAQVRVVSELLNLGADPNLAGTSERPLLLAVATHQADELASLLLRFGSDINAKSPATGRTALMAALDSPVMIPTLLVLLVHGADVSAIDNDGNNVLHLAIQKREDQVALNFLDLMDPAGGSPCLKNKANLSPLALLRKRREESKTDSEHRPGGHDDDDDDYHDDNAGKAPMEMTKGDLDSNSNDNYDDGLHFVSDLEDRLLEKLVELCEETR